MKLSGYAILRLRGIAENIQQMNTRPLTKTAKAFQNEQIIEIYRLYKQLREAN